MVKLKVFGYLAKTLNEDCFNVPLRDSASIYQVILTCAEVYGSKIVELLIDENQNAYQSFLIIVNGELIKDIHGVFVTQGDEIVILPPTAGG